MKPDLSITKVFWETVKNILPEFIDVEVGMDIKGRAKVFTTKYSYIFADTPEDAIEMLQNLIDTNIQIGSKFIHTPSGVEYICEGYNYGTISCETANFDPKECKLITDETEDKLNPIDYPEDLNPGLDDEPRGIQEIYDSSD